MLNECYKVKSINVGKPQGVLYQKKEIQTAINKNPIEKPIFLAELNFAGDAQADLVHHGGKDKAVCMYAYEHYPYWKKAIDRSLELGAFGENVTVSGVLEEDVCIGDVFQLGEAMLQVSQPRQPCYKVANKWDVVDLPLQMQNTGFTGFYCRVLQEGWVFPEDDLQLIERHAKAISIAFVNQMMYHDQENLEGIRVLLDVGELSNNVREYFSKRLK